MMVQTLPAPISIEKTEGSASSRIITRFTMGGLLFGLMFPLGSWIFCFIVNDLPFFTLASIKEIHDLTPLHFVVDLAPFVLCGVAFLIGKRVDKHNQEHITQQRSMYRELDTKNRKLSDSINYAERIQKSIVPLMDELRAQFPETMLYFKPRDIVSGDFPWMYRQGNSIYLAAVDCTGHGVPGAMMAMVGYFLMNNILSIYQNISPADLLQRLNAEVSTTLRDQSDGRQTMDGMDISMVKIDLDTRQLTFSGAHRPLFYLADGELVELKGSRRSIGGHPRTHKYSFEDHQLSLDELDAIFLFSDGMQDQYSEAKNKFSMKRLRSLVAEKGKLPMADFSREIVTTYESWRGQAPQTDDMLMMAVRF